MPTSSRPPGMAPRPRARDLRRRAIPRELGGRSAAPGAGGVSGDERLVVRRARLLPRPRWTPPDHAGMGIRRRGELRPTRTRRRTAHSSRASSAGTRGRAAATSGSVADRVASAELLRNLRAARTGLGMDERLQRIVHHRRQPRRRRSLAELLLRERRHRRGAPRRLRGVHALRDARQPERRFRAREPRVPLRVRPRARPGRRRQGHETACWQSSEWRPLRRGRGVAGLRQPLPGAAHLSHRLTPTR